MTRSRIADELQLLRRQIALLKTREAELTLALGSLPEERQARPGWPIRRLTGADGGAQTHWAQHGRPA